MIRSVAMLFLLSACLPETQAAAQAPKRQPKPAVSARTLALYEPGEYRGVKYRLMKPIDFDPAKTYPLVLSLHGAGGRGTDNIRNLRNWNEYMADDTLRRRHPCFVLAPQSDSTWNDPTSARSVRTDLSDEDVAALPEAWRSRLLRYREQFSEGPVGNLHIVLELIDNKLAKEFQIDADRLYCLGHSMGGFGTFTAIYQHPERFAAAVPTAGGFFPWRDASRIKDIPIWTFHGSADETVPVEFTRYVFRRMQELGGNTKYTELRGVGHNANAIAFRYTGDDPAKGYVTQCASERVDKASDVWDWLFRQKLSDRQ
jgi:predicted peptidase